MADFVPATKLNIVPTFDSTLKLKQIEQINFRTQEPWGRWLLSHRAKLVFDSPKAQHIELYFKSYLPYEKQWGKLVVNSQIIFRELHRPQMSGEFGSHLLIEIQKGRNTLEIMTNRSNLDGLGSPFARSDGSDISVGLRRLDFMPVQVQSHFLYGLQPSSFIGSPYSSAGQQGLTKLFTQRSPLTVEYRLLRRFEHQGFTFNLDGKSVYSPSDEGSGNLLIGKFNLPSTIPYTNNIHVLKVRSLPIAPSAKPFSTTAQDDPDVQFYIQQLELKPTTSSFQTSEWAAGLLALLLSCLLWLLLFRHQRL